MTATAHALLGTVIAAKVANPLLAIPLALVSHIVADSIPHWDTATNEQRKTKERIFYESFVDVALGFILSYLLLKNFFPQTQYAYAFLLIITAQFFDWITAPYYFFRMQSFKWAYDFQKRFDHKLDKPLGIVYQIAFLTTVILFAIGIP